MKDSLPSPLFQCWKQINIHEAFATLFGGGGGGGGGTTDEKGVFIQIQNIIVSSKALVLVNCLNTFVHDCICCSGRMFSLLERKHCEGFSR